ncbi:MAG TPA: hypothetical protein VEJ89_00730 [Myxococcaceae bacterium]|nr:hypothetical protein [Myxococcaceae bacterium]
MDPDLAELYGKVVADSQVAGTPAVSVLLTLTAEEVRSIVVGARLLDVKASRLVSWAGSVNAEDRVLPRWHRPFVVEGQLVRLCLLLDPGEHRVATRVAARFGLETETLLAARTFQWLRRIRERRLDDPRWKRLEVPGPRTPWRPEPAGGGGPRLA